MKLLSLDGGALSLEFEAAERDLVKQRLASLGTVAVVEDATFDRIRVCGEEFIWLDEWDEPCLISQSPQGSALLRRLIDQPELPRVATG